MLVVLQGEEYVNSKTLTDVTFKVEGREFYAHRIALLASSEAFRAMFGQVSSAFGFAGCSAACCCDWSAGYRATSWASSTDQA